MKILIPVDPEIPVPPKLYGGVERLVDGLITEYSFQGHEVYLLAHSNSFNPSAKKIFYWEGADSRNWRHTLQNGLKLNSVINEVKPDFVHHYARLLYTYPYFLAPIKHQTSFLMSYGRKISSKSTRLAAIVGHKRMYFSACAAHMLAHLAGAPHWHKFHTIYNFTDIHFFKPDESLAKEHLFFLGRIEDIKGTKEAIEVAIATDEKLIIAGNIQPGHDAYFNTQIKPYLDHPLIEYVGPVNDEQKLYYLKRSKALLFPIKWEEPFGIVMAEAMACGVPVIGFGRGSVPEVIQHGTTGFIVNNTSEMIEAVGKIDTLNRNMVRKECVARFSREVIASEYLKLFNTIIVKNTP